MLLLVEHKNTTAVVHLLNYVCMRQLLQVLVRDAFKTDFICVEFVAFA